MRRASPREPNPLVALATKALVRSYCRAFVRVNLVGLSNLPATGPAIVVANHRSMLDGFLLYSFLGRELYPFIQATYFRNRLLRWYLSAGGGIPISGGGPPLSSFKRATMLLRHQKMLLIFPEGRVNPGSPLLPFQHSFVRLALREGALVVPVLLCGTEFALGDSQLFPRLATVRVVVREPIRLVDSFGHDQPAGYYAQQVQDRMAQDLTTLLAAETAMRCA